MKRPNNLVSSNIKNCLTHDNVPSYDIKGLIDAAIGPDVWLKHLTDDLMAFWDTDDAVLMENGLFKTYRGNDGKPLSNNKEEWPPEIKAALADDDAKGLIEPEYNFLRAHSRQTYSYGIAFHMTGKSKYLELCRNGALALANAMDGNYGMYTKNKINNNTWDKDYNARNSQDLAYGLTGLGMYYFLTHDPNILHKLIQVKDYIFKFYFDKGRGYITWFPKKKNDNDIEIVSQLDQLYAYMLMLTPTLPEPYKTEWKKDLKIIADVLIEVFYSEKYEFFWGFSKSSSDFTLGAAHTDFGHSVKTLWIILKIGEILHKPFYIDFARQRIDKILDNAYIEKTGSWARRFDENGKRDENKEWWILAELDQACEILSLNDPSYLSYLNNTQKYWLNHMVDKEYGEIWHMVDTSNEPVLKYPKVHSWKTSLHSFEHALFSFMTSSRIKGETFELYYAIPEWERVSHRTVAPYMFRANVVDYCVSEKTPSFMPDGNAIYKVTFDSLH